ncbi:MAG: hypothetical protein WBV73_05685 [Phormidium sp.]
MQKPTFTSGAGILVMGWYESLLEIIDTEKTELDLIRRFSIHI